jgi:hypothetical protein
MLSEYALKDSELCLDLWKKYSDQWPDSEKEISNLNRKIVSNLNRKIVQGGIPIDQSLLKDQLEKVKVRLFEAEQNIPWIEESPLLSRAAFDNQCRLVGLEPPASLAATDEKAQEWIELLKRNLSLSITQLCQTLDFMEASCILERILEGSVDREVI